MIQNVPSDLPNAAGSPQTGTPSVRPFSEVGLPSLAKTCHASAPPFCQPVPSVQASNVSPFELAAMWLARSRPTFADTFAQMLAG